MKASANKLNFPLTWYGKLITHSDAGDVRGVIQLIFLKLKLTDGMITASKASAEGKYTSWSLQATLPDNDTMQLLFANLEAVPGIRMLL